MSNESRPRKHEFSPTPSEVLRYFLVCLRGFHNNRERSKVADWAMVGLTALGLIAAAVSAVFLYLQLRDAQNNFTLDERAWIEVEVPKVVDHRVEQRQTKEGLSEREIFIYEIYLRNVGKTPAKNVVMSTGLYPAGFSKEDESKNIAEWFKKNQPPSKLILVVMPPNATVQAPREQIPEPTWHVNIEGIPVNEELSRRFLVGRIDYQDEFGVRHWERFCFAPARNAYGELSRTGELRPCDFGNEQDQNP